MDKIQEIIEDLREQYGFSDQQVEQSLVKEFKYPIHKARKALELEKLKTK